MRKLMIIATLGAVAWSGAAWAVVDETQDVPVTDQSGAIPQGSVTLKTTQGETIAHGSIHHGVVHLVVHSKKVDRDSKIVVIAYDDDTKKETRSEIILGSFLDTGLNVSTGGPANGLASGFISMPGLPFGGNHWYTVGVGLASTHNNATGDFFGSGTGSGVSLTDDNWSEAVQFSGGIFASVAPSWYGGLVVNVITPPFNSSTASGVTSNDIAVTSKTEPGVAVDVLGRVGVLPSGFRYLNLHEVFLEGGAETEHFTGKVVAPMVNDFFSASKQVTAPVIGAGFGFCPFGIASNGMCTGPEAIVEYDHTFFDTNWTVGSTIPSSGRLFLGGEDRITAGIAESFYDFYGVPSSTYAR
jgi:hypothetical protein